MFPEVVPEAPSTAVLPRLVSPAVFKAFGTAILPFGHVHTPKGAVKLDPRRVLSKNRYFVTNLFAKTKQFGLRGILQFQGVSSEDEMRYFDAFLFLFLSRRATTARNTISINPCLLATSPPRRGLKWCSRRALPAWDSRQGMQQTSPQVALHALARQKHNA